jgi:putative NADPH-quinone reductase
MEWKPIIIRFFTHTSLIVWVEEEQRPMKDIPLIINLHPTPDKSYAGEAIISALKDSFSSYVYKEVFGDENPTVKALRKLIDAHDIIIMTAPIYWGGLPGESKLWLEELLEYGWAYELDEDQVVYGKLSGKKVYTILTHGRSKEEYSRSDGNLPSSYDALTKICKDTIWAFCGAESQSYFLSVFKTNDDITSRKADKIADTIKAKSTSVGLFS